MQIFPASRHSVPISGEEHYEIDKQQGCCEKGTF